MQKTIEFRGDDIEVGLSSRLPRFERQRFRLNNKSVGVEEFDVRLIQKNAGVFNGIDLRFQPGNRLLLIENRPLPFRIIGRTMYPLTTTDLILQKRSIRRMALRVKLAQLQLTMWCDTKWHESFRFYRRCRSHT